MKLFSWAHKKLLLTHSPDKNHIHAGGSLDIRRHNHACHYEQVEVRAKPSSETHAEVLTIGTLGMGNLLSLKKEEDEEEEEEEEEEDEEEEDDDDDEEEEVVHFVSPIAERLSPKRESMSSNRDSVSSNRESVSSVDIQKLQEELQKILYFKLGQEGNPPCTSTGSRSSVKGGKGKARKQNARRAEDISNGVQLHDSARESHVGSTERKSVRQLLPLRNFLEMPMDSTTVTTTSAHNGGEGGPPCKLLSQQHYRLLMQSLKSRLLHCSAPTRVSIPAPLFEKLVKQNVKEPMPQHATTMNKALRLLQRVTKRGPNGWQMRSKKANPNIDKMHADIQHNDEEESLNWAISRSYRGSERFINYITNTIAKQDMNDKITVDNQQKDHQYDNGLPLLKKGGNMEARLSTSHLLGNESWVNTDDEYFVLEL